MTTVNTVLDTQDPQTAAMLRRVGSYMRNLGIEKRSDLDRYSKVKGVGPKLLVMLEGIKYKRDLWEECFPDIRWDI
jgi:hypothetical protein